LADREFLVISKKSLLFLAASSRRYLKEVDEILSDHE
jgi:hypothetical protein